MQPPRNHPNILIILSDQHRWNTLGCYGNADVISPAFDRMAAEGVRFTRSLCCSPVCSPFRGTLQTGLYPHHHGITNNNMRFRPGLDYMAQCFANHGYSSCYIGKAHWHDTGGRTDPGYIPPGFRCGWQEWYGQNRGHYPFDMPDFDDNAHLTHRYQGEYEPEVQTGIAIDFMKRTTNLPWIMQLNWGAPHNASQYHLFVQEDVQKRMQKLNTKLGLGLRPEQFHPQTSRFPAKFFPQQLVEPIVPKRYMDIYDRETLGIDPNVDENLHTCMRYRLHEYYAMITSLDDQLARLLHAVRELPRNTIVLYTSDHGDLLGSFGQPRGKVIPVQNALRTPLIAWGREGIQRGRTVDTLVNAVDLMPTILDLAGLDIPDKLPGVSAADWCTGESGPDPEDVLLELGNWRALWTGDYLYAIEARDDMAVPLRLTDLRNDPWDQINLADDARSKAIRDCLHNRLIERIRLAADTEFLAECGITASTEQSHEDTESER